MDLWNNASVVVTVIRKHVSERLDVQVGFIMRGVCCVRVNFC
jgi:hypothetical protein